MSKTSNGLAGRLLPVAHGSANTPLRAEVKDGKLVIEIGIKTLEWASNPENGGTLERCKVDGRRRREWAQDVVREMTHEDGVGESPLMRFMDEMMEKAADNGSGALCWPNDPSSATRPTGRTACNRDAHAGFAAAHG